MASSQVQQLTLILVKWEIVRVMKEIMLNIT